MGKHRRKREGSGGTARSALAIFLSLVMTFNMLPTQALAEEMRTVERVVQQAEPDAAGTTGAANQSAPSSVGTDGANGAGSQGTTSEGDSAKETPAAESKSDSQADPADPEAGKGQPENGQPADNAATVDSQATPAMPAFEQSSEAAEDGVTVTVRAPEGVFPEGSKLRVQRLSGDAAEAALSAVGEARGEQGRPQEAAVLDVRVLDAAGAELPGDKSAGATVTFSAGGREAEVFAVAPADGALRASSRGAIAADAEASFESDGTTTYVVAFAQEAKQEEATDPQAAPAMPAFEQSSEAAEDGVTVTVRAPEGVFPEGSKLRVQRLSGDAGEAALSAVGEARGEQGRPQEAAVLDVRVVDAAGAELPGDKSAGATVTFSAGGREAEVFAVAPADGALRASSRAKIAAGEAEAAVEPDGATTYVVAFAQEAKQQEEMPAFNQSKTVDGVVVTVEADEGIFPKGATLNVQTVSAAVEQKVEDAVDEVRDTSREVAASYTFDIKVLDKDGKEVQPADDTKVHVSFKTQEVAEELCQTEVYHVEDATAAKPEVEQLDVVEENASTQTATVETDGFSEYVLIFSQGKITYEMNNASESLESLMSAVGLHGKLWNVVSSDSARLTVTGPSETESTASQWSISAAQNITDANPVVLTISLYNRPDYRVTVCSNGVPTQHKVVLVHRDGHSVTTSQTNPRFDEVLEVIVSGYTDSEAQNLYYKYTCTYLAPNGLNWLNLSALTANDALLPTYDSSDLGTLTRSRSDQGQKPYTLTSGKGYSQDHRYILFVQPKGSDAYGGNVPQSVEMTLRVDVYSDSNLENSVGYDTFTFTLDTNSLEKDLKDVERALPPIVLYQNGEDSTGINIKNTIGTAGIAHFGNCENSTVRITVHSESSKVRVLETNEDVVVGDSNSGHESIDVTVTKGTGCKYHKGQSASAKIDTYTLAKPVATLSGNTITVANLNPWCKYQVVDTDGNVVIETKSPELADATAEDEDKQLKTANETITFSGLTVGKTYKIVEIIDINFALEQGSASSNTILISDVDRPNDSATDTITVTRTSHTHVWRYELDSDDSTGATILATCTADGCTNPAASATLMIGAPESLTYDAAAKSATLTPSDTVGAFTGVGEGDITYYTATKSGDAYTKGQELSDGAKPTAAGDYVAEVAVGSGDDAVTASVGYTITKAAAPSAESVDNDSKPSAVENLVYNGNPCVVISAPTGSLPDGYNQIQYSIDGGAHWYTACDADELKKTNAGSYTVKYKYVDTDGNHADLVDDSLTITASIGKKTLTEDMLVLSDTAFTFNDGVQAPGITVTDEAPAVLTEDDYTVTITDADGHEVTETKAAGTYTVTLSAKADGNYANPTGGPITKTFTINPLEASDSAVSVTYAEGKGGPYTYTGSAQAPAADDVVVTVTIGTGNDAKTVTLVKGTDYTLDIPTDSVNAGNYNITVTFIGNYAGTTSKSLGYTINAVSLTADDVVGAGLKPTVAGGAEGLTYNGQPRDLVVAPTDDLPSGYQMEYSKDNGANWTTTIPQETNANTGYTVLYRYAAMDSNHTTLEDNANFTLTVPIAQGENTVNVTVADAENWTYGDSAHAVTYSGKFSGNGTIGAEGDTATVQYYKKGEGDSWTPLASVPTDAGDYKVVVTVPADSANNNWRESTGEATFTIEKLKYNTPQQVTAYVATDLADITIDILGPKSSSTEKIEYGYKKTGTNSDYDWVDAPEEEGSGGVSVGGTRLENLEPGTSYDLVARVKAMDENHESSDCTVPKTCVTSVRVTITGACLIGQPLTASVEPVDEGYTYQWYRIAALRNEKIASATEKTYTPVDADLGRQLICIVSKDDKQCGTSERTGVIGKHQHTWEYRRSDDKATLTATCTNVDGAHQGELSVSITLVAPSNVTYPGPAEATITGKDAFESATGATVGQITYLEDSGNEGYIDGNNSTVPPTKAGNYTAEVNVTPHNSTNENEITLLAPFTIGKAAADQSLITDDVKNHAPNGVSNIVYIGAEQQLVDETGVKYPAGYNAILYSLDGTNWVTASDLKAKDVRAGGYTIQYKYVDTDGNHEDLVPSSDNSFTSTIKPKDLTLTAQKAAKSKTYGEADPDMTVTLSAAEGVVAGDTVVATLTRADGDNAGDYPYTGATSSDANYKIMVPSDAKFTINPVPAINIENLAEDEKPSANTLTFNNQNQNLVTNPASQKMPGGYDTVEYLSKNDQNQDVWSTTIPQAKDAGSYTVTYRYKDSRGNHTTTDSATLNASIAKKNIDGASVTAEPASVTYDGTAKEPTSVTVTVDGITLSDDDFTTSCTNNVNIGEATVTVTAKDNSNFVGTATGAFTIDAASVVENGDPTGAGQYKIVVSGITDTTYNGADQKPATVVKLVPSVSDGNDGWEWDENESNFKTLTEGATADYTVSYKKGTASVDAPKDAADYTVVVTLSANYGSSSFNKDYKISPKALTNGDVTLTNDTLTYTGEAQGPTVTVKDGTTTLTLNTDYTITDGTATEAGEHTLTVTGTGNYSGTVTKTFKINKATLDPTKLTDVEKPSANTGTDGQGLVYTATDQNLVTEPAADKVPTGYKLQCKLAAAGEDEWSDTIPTGKNAGDYSVVYKYVPTDNNHEEVTSTSFKIDVSIGQADLSKATITVNPDSEVFDGNDKTPSVTVTLASGQTLSANEYDVVITKGDETVTKPKQVAGYTYTANAKGGNVTGSKSTAYSVTAQSVGANDVRVEFDQTSEDTGKLTYNGQRQTPAVGTSAKVYVGNSQTPLVEGTDYDVVYPEDSTNAGTYTAKIVLKGDYMNAVDPQTDEPIEITSTYSIGQRPITVAPSEQVVSPSTSTGNAIQQGKDHVSVTAGSLVEGHGITDATLTQSTTTAGEFGTISIAVNEGNPQVTIKSGETDVTANYAITVGEPAKLTIKATQTAPSDDDKAGLVNKQETTSITINAKAGYEYVITTSPTAPTDDADWSTVETPASNGTGYHKATTDGTHEFTGLTKGTAYYVHMRKAAVDPDPNAQPNENPGADPSPSVTVPTSTRPDALNGDDPTAILDIDYVNETATPKAGNEAKKDGQADTAYTTNAIDIDPGDTLQVRVAGTSTVAPSDPVHTVLATRPPAPANVMESTGNDNQVTKTDTTITINPTVAGQQYIVLPKGQTPSKADWLDASKTQSSTGSALTFTGLNANTEYDVFTRTAAVAPAENVTPAFASANAGPTTVKTKAAEKQLTNDEKQALGDTWSSDDADPNKIVVNGTVGYEYLVLPKGTPAASVDWSKASKCTADGGDFTKGGEAPDYTYTKEFDKDSNGNIIAENTDYDILVRKSETSTDMPSAPETIGSYTTKPAPTNASDCYDVDYSTYLAETVTPKSGYEISSDGGTTWSSTAVAATPGGAYLVRSKAGSPETTDHESEAAGFTLPDRPEATGATVQKSDVQVTVTNATSSQQYVLVPANASDVQIQDAFNDPSKVKTPAAGTTLVAFDAEQDTAYKVVTRVPPTASTFASAPESTGVTTKRSAPTGDIVDNVVKEQTSTSITINTTPQYEYVLTTSPTAPTDADWSSVDGSAGYYKEEGDQAGTHTFGDLDPNTTYYVHMRLAATDGTPPKEAGVPATKEAPTRPEAPTAATVVAKSDTRVAVTDSDAAQEYVVLPKKTGDAEYTAAEILAAFEGGHAQTGNGGELVIGTDKDGSPLQPGTDYMVYNRTKAVTEGQNQAIASDPAGPTAVTTKTATADLTSDDQNTLKDKTWDATTANPQTIVVNGTEGYEYLVLPTATVTADGFTPDWTQASMCTTDGGDFTKGGEDPNFTYTKEFTADSARTQIAADTDYTILVRKSETGQSMPSNPVEVPAYTTQTPPEPGDNPALGGEGYTVDYPNERIEVEAGYEVRLTAPVTDPATEPADWTIGTKGEDDKYYVPLTPGATYEIRKVEEKDQEGKVTKHESTPTSFTTNDRPDAEDVTKDDLTYTDKTVTIDPTTKDQQYVILPAKDAQGNTISYTDEQIADAFDGQNAKTSQNGEALEFSKDGNGNDLVQDTEYVVFTRVPATDSTPKSATQSENVVTRREEPAVDADDLIDECTSHTIKINTQKGYEYVVTESPYPPANELDWATEVQTSGDNGYYKETAETGTHEFTGLTPSKQYYVHVREVAQPANDSTVPPTPAKDPSVPATVPAVTERVAPVAGEGHEEDYPNEVIKVEDGYEIRVKPPVSDGAQPADWAPADGDTTYPKDADGNTLIPLVPGTTYEIRQKADPNTIPALPESEHTDFTIASRPEASPIADDAVTSTDTSVTVEPTVPGQEYVVVPKGTDPKDIDWSKAQTAVPTVPDDMTSPGKPITFETDDDGNPLKPDTEYEVVTRVPATGQAPKSESTSVGVTTLREAPDAPKDIDKTDTTITVKPSDAGQEYIVLPVKKDDDGKPVPYTDEEIRDAFDNGTPKNGTPGNGGDLVLDKDAEGNPLQPGTDYAVYNRTKAVTEPASDAKSASYPAGPTAVTTKTSPADAPTNATKQTDPAPSSVTIEGKAGEEYVLVPKGTDPKDVNWSKAKKTDPADQDGPITFTETQDGKPLTPDTDYEVVSRVAETDDAMPSQPRKDEVYTTKEGKDDGHTENYSDETITVEPGYEIRVTSPAGAEPATWAPNDKYPADKDGKTVIPLTPGATYEIREKQVTDDKGNVTHHESTPTEFTVAERPAAPKPVSADDINATDSAVTIEPTVAGQEYIVVPKGTTPTEDDWANAGKTSQKGEALTFDKTPDGRPLAPNTEYEVVTRVPATNTGDSPAPHSDSATPTPAKTDQIQSAPESNEKAVPNPTSVTLEGCEPGQEYVIVPKGTPLENVDWSTAQKPGADNTVTFEKDADGNNLVPGQEYTVYNRIPGDATHEPSEPSSIDVKTPRGAGSDVMDGVNADGGVAPMTNDNGCLMTKDGGFVKKGDDGKYYPADKDGKIADDAQPLTRNADGSLSDADGKIDFVPAVMVVGTNPDAGDGVKGKLDGVPEDDGSVKVEAPVYDAEEHAPTAYDNHVTNALGIPEQLEKGKDYTVSYYRPEDIDEATGLPKPDAKPLNTTDPDADDYAFDAGEAVAVVTFQGDFAGTVSTPMKIKKREMHVSTPSASKVYDGEELKSQEPSVWVDGQDGVPQNAGLVKDQTVEVKVTGKQTQVGTSKNSYTIRFRDEQANADDPSLAAMATSWVGGVLGARMAYADGESLGLTHNDDEEPTAKRKNYEEEAELGDLTVTASTYDVSENTGLSGSGKRISVNPIAKDDAAAEPNAKATSSVTYDGKPIAGPVIYDTGIDGNPKRLVEGVDYKVTYKDADGNVVENPTDAGTYTMVIDFMGDYSGSKEFKVTIDKAKLTVTTPSASKVYDGEALTATDGTKLEGLVNNETAKVEATGSQTQVGNSKNTYRITWETAKESNYKVAKENLGKLTVTAVKTSSTPAAASSRTTSTTVPKTRDDTNAAVPVVTALIGVMLALAGRFRRRGDEAQEEPRK